MDYFDVKHFLQIASSYMQFDCIFCIVIRNNSFHHRHLEMPIICKYLIIFCCIGIMSLFEKRFLNLQFKQINLLYIHSEFTIGHILQALIKVAIVFQMHHILYLAALILTCCALICFDQCSNPFPPLLIFLFYFRILFVRLDPSLFHPLKK